MEHDVFDRARRSSVMGKRLLAILCLLGAVFVLSLSGCGDTRSLFHNVTMNLDSYVGLDDSHVNVQTVPEVNVNHPFTVTAMIASRHPLSSLSGSGYDVSLSSPNVGGTLAEILRPPASYTGSYSLCLIVDLHLDDDSAFELDNIPAPFNTEQEFTVVPDVTAAQSARWTFMPRDTFGFETVSHAARARVWFDAETTCRLGNPSLLGDWFYLGGSSRSVVLSTTFTVVNEDLRQQRAIMAHFQPIAVAAVAAMTTASVGWAAGFFGWVRRRRKARGKQGASENVTHRSAAKRIWLSDDILPFFGPGGALLGIGMWLITLGPSTVVYYLGVNATLGSFFGGIVVALVGIWFLASGVRRIRLAYA
jgi:hypothetical protein